MDTKLISVDLRARFGFLKKPDINEGIYLTYNCLHKPALLGILGAIVGVEGYAQSFANNEESFPAYYQKLNSLKIGIQPLDSANGNYQKTVIAYNNSVGYANKDGGTLIVKEQTLLKPAYRIFILANTSEEIHYHLYHNLKNGESVFIPYLGKNDFQLWWDSFTEYEFEEKYKPQDNYQIETIFLKKEKTTIRKSAKEDLAMLFDFSSQSIPDFFIYFENLPIEFDDITKHYRFASFVYTNKTLNKNYVLNDVYLLKKENKIIQLI